MPNLKRRRIAAIMFTDIVGYTALMQKDEQEASAARSRHRHSFKKHHARYHGEIIQYFGDGTLSVFQSAVEAVECAIAIQRDLQRDKPVPLRIGLHMGDIVFEGTEVYGDGVNVASRIENLAEPGTILLSAMVQREITNQSHISTTLLGQVELKNVNASMEVFAVSNPGIKIPSPKAFELDKTSATKSIAVLPFINMSSSKDNEYFSDGMTEEIINALAQIKELKVTSRTSSFHFKHHDKPLSEIGKALNVSTVLEGSIRMSANKIRVTAQLVDVADDFHFWSETFDRDLDDIFAVQDEISLLIADRLREHIGHFDIGDHLVSHPDVSLDVYKDYLKARYHILKMGKHDLEKGLTMLKDIIERQPDFALAHLGVHLAYTLLGTIGLMPAAEAFSKGQPYLDHAIELDEDLPECQLNLSYMAFLNEWDLQKTYGHLEKSFELRPTVEYYQSMASTLVAEGKFSAADNYLKTAFQLDPFSPINHHLKGFISYCSEDYHAAIESFDSALDLKGDFSASILYYGQALLMMGKKQDGLSHFTQITPDITGDLVRLGGMTLAYAVSNYREEALAGVSKLEAMLETDLMGRALHFLIFAHALLDEQEKSLQYIEKGIASRLPMMVYLNIDPMLNNLRVRPEFPQLMQQILGQEPSILASDRKYQQPLFSPVELSKREVELVGLMEQSKPFLNPKLSLRDLAEMLDMPPNHLSQLLNEGVGKNFSDFVNAYRLATFKEKVDDPTQRHLTILALAYESGFNSKTVFNTYFKKEMGTTPSAYWKEMTSK
ncbi:MAG: helix-turn-helix domain-containing protein [Saprospiraceae bacterium]|nr:helix-turn-helix domain-containing protein [Saprospiraceae bacterium]